jgi:hypothetical protein
MGATAHLSTDAAARRARDTSAMHNASVNEDAARLGACAQVHLPTGRMCTLPRSHRGSCDFRPPEDAYASLPHQRSDERR